MAAVRPRDAATVILLRGSGPDREVLLGRRPSTARFMPEVFVFPGGALEPQDSEVSCLPEDFGPPPGESDARTRALWPALLRCALRELYEETGLLLSGGPCPQGTAGPQGEAWQAFREVGRLPGFSSLSLVHRAVTPASSPIRFDTRFLRASGELLGRLGGSGELEDLAWRPLAELAALPLRQVTRTALARALASPEAGHQQA